MQAQAYTPRQIRLHRPALAPRSSLGNAQNIVGPTDPCAPTSFKLPYANPSPDAAVSPTAASKPLLHPVLHRPPPNTNPFSASTASYDPLRRSTMDAGQDVAVNVGDHVQVPGGMTGTVKFLGAVNGKKGIFAGVELTRAFAARGKNDGDVDGTRYFTTSIPGSGIFLPAHRAVKEASPGPSIDAFPATPTSPAAATHDSEARNLRTASQTPPTPSISRLSQSARPGQRPNFSQSVGPAARATSPQLKRLPSRPSLPRPESPTRKQPGIPPTTPATTGRLPGAGFSQSVRGERPSGIAPVPKPSFAAARQAQTPSRSPSRSQSRTSSRLHNQSPSGDSTPTAFARAGAARNLSQSASRPSSSDADAGAAIAAKEESATLRRQLEDRDTQLKEQATSLAEMESSLAELQSMVAGINSRSPPPTNRNSTNSDETKDADTTQLRQILREKNEKIAVLTAEFDAHRADFRSTIDTLEMASTETERVYEKRVDELVREVQELTDERAGGDVENVARQLKQLEELVQELEEGLEDARRGEAEARGEVEFLRGEVERGRSELRRERDKAAKAQKGAGDAARGPETGGVTSKELEARDDEIRGLKAIIHSLSSGPEMPSPAPRGSTTHGNGAGSRDSGGHAADKDQLARLRSNMEELNRDKAELKGLIERKNYREEELERELNSLRAAVGDNRNGSGNATASTRKHSDSVASTKTAIRPGTGDDENASGVPTPLPLSFKKDGTANTQKGPETPRPGTSHSTSDNWQDASELLPTHGSAENHSSNGVAKHSPGPSLSATGDGPAPGKASRKIDMSKWCALCERDGHESVDCPFEEDF